MKIKNTCILLVVLSIAAHAEPSNKEKINDWYQSAKAKTEKVLESGKQSAGKGLETTTEFLNKTSAATKEGFKAFTTSFKKNSAKEAEIKRKNIAQKSPYLNINGYQACVSIKDSDKKENVCLPKERPLLCKEAIFSQLKTIKSPKSC